MSKTEKPTPPMPPDKTVRNPETVKGSRVTDRRDIDVACPQCRTNMIVREVATGEMMIAIWDRDFWDPEKYTLSTEYERTEREQVCPQCGFVVSL